MQSANSHTIGKALLVVLIGISISACGGGSGGGLLPLPTMTAARTATPTEFPTATPSSTPSGTPTSSATPSGITYRLIEGSTILFAASTPAVPPPVPVPLSGTFSVFQSNPAPPNTVFTFTITKIDFQGGSDFLVTDGNRMPFGCAGEISLGCIQSLTLDFPRRVYASMLVSINGQGNLQLFGGGLLDSTSDPPTFNNLNICGGSPEQSSSCDAIRSGNEAGYALTIFAVPEG